MGLRTAWLVAAIALVAAVPAAAGRVRPVAGSPVARGSDDGRDLVDWIRASRDNRGLPFIIIDKVSATVAVFGRDGQPLAAAPALLGLGKGDDSAPGIGDRPLAAIPPADRTTPAGRFEAALGRDLDQGVLWVDYKAALSLHRVIVGSRRDRRAARLASPTPLDNRISFGCINVPPDFYDGVVVPAFTGTVGIVYILPETRPLRAVFPVPASPARRSPAA